MNENRGLEAMEAMEMAARLRATEEQQWRAGGSVGMQAQSRQHEVGTAIDILRRAREIRGDAELMARVREQIRAARDEGQALLDEIGP